MAMGGAGGGGHVRGRRRARKRPLSEINVTPLVDVMLVLLEQSRDPVSLSIDRNGNIFVGESETRWEQLILRVAESAGETGRETPVFIRADGAAPYQAVARVMARLSASGFTRLNLITDTAPQGSPASDPEG